MEGEWEGKLGEKERERGAERDYSRIVIGQREIAGERPCRVTTVRIEREREREERKKQRRKERKSSIGDKGGFFFL